MRGVYWHPDSWEAYTEKQSDRSFLKKTNALIKDIQRNGYQCSYGKPEMLKGHLQGYASVKIDKKNRLVFSVDDLQVSIVECGGHYHDH
ncbi:MAG: Txe/YoeB family addiction module toxin [Synergistaceae bacterium]|nr:Txe/YoeB family addiction module toxin [Synergistaceae bacterium]MBR0257124.1 Txe/YoeB family addiction module toxin [Synergistaceae bacterium]